MKKGFTLAEVFIPHSGSQRKIAFTLAEVLITIGIIGVVATMTLPSLIKNYRKVEIETGLKKSYNTLQNAIALSEIDNGPIKEWPEKDLTSSDLWNIYFKPYLKNAKLCKVLTECHGYKNVDMYKWHNQNEWYVATSNELARILFQLQDGTVIFWLKDITDETQTHRTIMIDTNGARGPNKGGYDVFILTKDYSKNKIIAEEGDCATNVKYCAYEIISNGWKFPDDYPYKI